MNVVIKDLRVKGRALALLLLRDEARELARQCADKADLTSLDQPNQFMRMQARLEAMEQQLDRLFEAEGR